jgi:hypothetical protein
MQSKPDAQCRARQTRETRQGKCLRQVTADARDKEGHRRKADALVKADAQGKADVSCKAKQMRDASQCRCAM